MKLLVVTNYFDTHRGGLEIVAGALAREFSTRRFEVAWLASDASLPDGAAAGIRFAPLPTSNIAEARLGLPIPLLGPKALFRIAREARACDAVVLHDTLYMSSVAGFLAAKWFRKPVLIVQHIGEIPYTNGVLRRLMKLGNLVVARPLLAGADQVVFISEVTRQFFRTVKFRRPAQLIFNGVDISTFHPASSHEAAAPGRRALGLPPETTVALFVGRFVEKKGVDLLRMMAMRRPDMVWAFAGWGGLDPRRWGLPNVRVFSELKGGALADLYRASDVLVLPSRGEGFPLVVQEALACGLPVVCGSETMAADPEAAAFLDGVRIDRSDRAVVDDLCRALDVALARPRDAAGTRAYYARQHYSWTTAGERYADLIRGLIQRSRLPPVPRPDTHSPVSRCPGPAS